MPSTAVKARTEVTTATHGRHSGLNQGRIRVAARLFPVALMVLLATSALGGSRAVGAKHVLLLYPSDRRASFTAIEDEVIRGRLSAYNQRVEVFSENLDPALDANFYRNKYRDIHFDAIVCDREDALAFCLSHRADVFKNAPLIFHSVNLRSEVLNRLEPGVTGVEVDHSLLPSVEVIRQLQPGVSKVAVILSANKEARLAMLDPDQAAVSAKGISLDYWTGLTTDELRDNLQKLPPHAAALFVGMHQDREGRALVSRSVLTEIASSSKVPIYSMYSSYLGLGAVGGAVIDPSREANLAADLLERVLNGENPESLKVVSLPRRIVFDARALKRYRIAESRLPAGSEVLFRQPSAWMLYRSYTLAALLFLLLETGLVTILLIQRRRTKRAQVLLERRFDIERVISEYATRLSSCPAERVGREIEKGLQAVLEVEKLDLASWMICDDHGCTNRNLYSAMNNFMNAEPLLNGAPELAWTDQCLLRGQAVVLRSVEDLPPEAQADRAFLQQRGIKSIVWIPSSTGDATRAVLVLACRGEERAWPQALVNRLSVAGNIFANAMMRKRAQESSQQSEQRFRSLFAEAPIGIALEDLDGKLLFVNPALCSMLGYSMEEMTSMDCSQFADAEDQVEDWNQFQKLRRGATQGYHIEKRYIRKDGARIWGRLNVSLIKGASGSAIVLATVEDITEKKTAIEGLLRAHTELQQFTPRLLEAQEQERKRIARELHDDIGQRLSLLMMELDLLKGEMPVERAFEQSRVLSMLGQLDEIISDVHNMSHDLHSSKLQHLGLSVALKEVCRRVSSQRQVVVELVTGDLPHPLPEQVSLCFYRVAQEALSNAVKHSNSPRVDVILNSDGQNLRMAIRDFGVGFDPSRRDKGLGLATMHERLRMIGGRLVVNSTLGKGTELIAEAELPAAAKVA